jgi:tight adherence protein B
VVATFGPYLIVAAVASAVGYFGWKSWDTLVRFVAPFTEPFQSRLERAGIRTEPTDLAFRILAIAIVAWGVYIYFIRPPAWLALIALPLSFTITFYGTGSWIKLKTGQRLAKFNDQLEVALRLMTSGLRAGLGLRQAMIVVVSEMPDPIRVEFNRVLNQTSIGVSLYDALDQFNDRMPSPEMLMLTRSIRIQSKTGGNLGRTLETLAETIKQRRRIDRKVRAVTSEARFSSYIIAALPLLPLVTILLFEPEMRGDLLGTWFGRVILIVTFCLDALALYIMASMAKVDV